MKQSALKNVIAILLLFILISSCSKSSDHSKTKTELIAQNTWRFSNATVGGSDVSAFLQSCQKDNILTFAAPPSGTSSGDGNVDEGASKCNSGDPQTSSFTWFFQGAETTLHVTATLFTGGSTDFTLVSLSETQLVVSQNITVSGTTQNAVITFVH